MVENEAKKDQQEISKEHFQDLCLSCHLSNEGQMSDSDSCDDCSKLFFFATTGRW